MTQIFLNPVFKVLELVDDSYLPIRTMLITSILEDISLVTNHNKWATERKISEHEALYVILSGTKNPGGSFAQFTRR